MNQEAQEVTDAKAVEAGLDAEIKGKHEEIEMETKRVEQTAAKQHKLEESLLVSIPELSS